MMCVGIDLNRAWPLDWGARGGEGLTPDNPCAEDYPGEYPLQPPEVTPRRRRPLSVYCGVVYHGDN
eukprot:scaffold49910_cov39-Prasinocladus_malaysianus.AAC.1